MPLLALETATRASGVALIADDGTDLGERTLPPDAKASSELHPAIRDLLADAGLAPRDLTGLGISVGPGAFTGLRVGIGTAKGLATALDLPVWPIDTLTAIAHNLDPHLRKSDPICPLLDVRKAEVCGCVYLPVDGAWHAPQTWFCTTPDRLPEHVPEGALIIGNALERYAPTIADQGFGARPGSIGAPRSIVVARLAHQASLSGKTPVSAANLRPVYVRDAEAEFLAPPRSPKD